MKNIGKMGDDPKTLLSTVLELNANGQQNNGAEIAGDCPDELAADGASAVEDGVEETTSDIVEVVEGVKNPYAGLEHPIEVIRRVPMLILIDDERGILDVTRIIFEAFNASGEILTFASCEEALRFFEEEAGKEDSRVKDWGLIICDEKIEGGMRGQKFAQIIKKFREERHLTFVSYSGNEEKEFKASLEEGTIDLFVKKPTSWPAQLEELAECLQRPWPRIDESLSQD